MKTAQEWVDIINLNVDALHDKIVDHANFDALQRDTWDAIRAQRGNVHHNVLALLRGDLDDVRS